MIQLYRQDESQPFAEITEEQLKFLEDELVEESTTDQDYAIAIYPRLSFGSGQRYASKGCYMVQLTKGPDPQLVKVSDWVIH